MSKTYARNTRKLKINNETGRGRTNWKCYDMLNELLGNRPATHPRLVLDTANGTLVVKGNERCDGCDDAVQKDNSLENVVGNSTSAVAAVRISSEPNSSRSNHHLHHLQLELSFLSPQLLFKLYLLLL